MSLILVIDDESQIRRLVRRILAQAGHDVIEAADGEAGLALLRARFTQASRVGERREPS